MKASELIYRLARAIEENGDCELTMATHLKNTLETAVEAKVNCLDIIEAGGVKSFEIYGEES